MHNLHTPSTNPLILALDFSNLEEAISWASEAKPFIGHVKVGLELFLTHGHKALEAISELGLPIFLDLKLHDIPNTVARSITGLIARFEQISMLTVHIAGGKEMLMAAKEAASDRVDIIGVTVLTSLASNAKVAETVETLASQALECGIHGLVCSGHELPLVKRITHNQLKTIVPGIRAQSSPKDDQNRTQTPEEALGGGADYLVLGRILTQHPQPLALLKEIYEMHLQGLGKQIC